MRVSLPDIETLAEKRSHQRTLVSELQNSSCQSRVISFVNIAKPLSQVNVIAATCSRCEYGAILGGSGHDCMPTYENERVLVQLSTLSLCLCVHDRSLHAAAAAASRQQLSSWPNDTGWREKFLRRTLRRFRVRRIQMLRPLSIITYITVEVPAVARYKH